MRLECSDSGSLSSDSMTYFPSHTSSGSTFRARNGQESGVWFHFSGENRATFMLWKVMSPEKWFQFSGDVFQEFLMKTGRQSGAMYWWWFHFSGDHKVARFLKKWFQFQDDNIILFWMKVVSHPSTNHACCCLTSVSTNILFSIILWDKNKNRYFLYEVSHPNTNHVWCCLTSVTLHQHTEFNYPLG